MKIRNLLFLSLLVIAWGCSSTTVPNPNESFINADAPYNGNVSGIYALEPYGTVGSWSGIDLKWKDSTGAVRSLSSYAGKVVLVSFWSTNPSTAYSEEGALDSVQHDMGDTVAIITIAEAAYQAVYTFDTLNKIKVQVVVDSAQLANIQYSELADGKVGWPETFVLSPNGTIPAYAEGYEPVDTLEKLVRAAYK